MRYDDDDDDDRDTIPFTMVISVSRLIRRANDRICRAFRSNGGIEDDTGEEIN